MLEPTLCVCVCVSVEKRPVVVVMLYIVMCVYVVLLEFPKFEHVLSQFSELEKPV